MRTSYEWMDVPEDWGGLKERLKVLGGNNKVSLD
jgi:hypothetical protein